MCPLVLLVLLQSLTSLVEFSEGHLIDGIFTEPTLERGYNLVAAVPRGATALNVTELRHTQNYLAVRLQDGSYLLNGNYNINWSGEYQAAGTTFMYFRQSPQNLESFSAAGPLTEPIDVMVLYQEPNPGIVYRYVVPGNLPNTHLSHKTVPGKTAEPDLSHVGHRRTDPVGPVGADGTSPPYLQRRYKKRKFVWKPSGYSECNKSCGGGVQTLKHICIREHTQAQVPEKRCHALEKPREIRLRCNIRPCPPKWRAAAWGKCSVSCGTGVRFRELECVQEVKPTLTMRIADGACAEPKTLATSEVCVMPPCEDEGKSEATTDAPQWIMSAWSQCSTTCGIGRRTRIVSCSTHSQHCNTEEKPSTQEICELEPCPIEVSVTTPLSSKYTSSQWLYTEWSHQCSAECGTGVQTRKVFCERSPEEEFCDQSSRPENSRACSSNKTCSGQWFTGPWSECSSDCDTGEQVREVVCVATLRGALRVVLDMNCPANKPETRIPCKRPPCSALWFMSDWTECSRTCGKGVQKREVECLTRDGQALEPYQTFCKDEDRPIARRVCNDYPCKGDIQGHINSHKALQVQNDPEISNGLEENPHCKDSIPNCNFVTQTWLCAYQYYKQSCCQSCLRAKQEID
ncbi:hypothetical protein KM043_004390 [Ampulex compressa]|nr:hypothetical protein KM043_004390 [Ampulex compressa]